MSEQNGVMHDLKPYLAYKDSDLPWLGKVPEHWNIRRGKTIFNCVDIRSSTGQEELLTVSSQHGVIPRKSANVTMFKAKSYIGYKLCWPNDLVINSLWAWAKGLGVSQYHGIISSAYGVYRLKPEFDGYARYMHQLVRSAAFQWELQVRSKGIWTSRLQLTDDAFLGAPFPLPPPDEQASIVRYLDYMDRRIRRYIRAKQKLIKLLEEQKQSIIHQAVTGQINVRTGQPYPAYKPSGVKWLGNVPEHWEVARLKNAAVVQTGLTLGKDYRGAETSSLPYLRVANVQHGRVDLSHVKYINVPRKEAEGATLRDGDVLMTEGGDIDKLGRGCVWRNEIPDCLHQNHIFAVRCRQETLLPEFLVGLMTSQHGRAYFQLTAKQTTNLASTNSTTLRAFPIMLPSVEEQKCLLDRVEEETRTINSTIDRAEKEISLLREYHTRLIADVVIGKRDVRQAASELPEGVEELELLDDEADIDADDATENDFDLEVEEEAA